MEVPMKEQPNLPGAVRGPSPYFDDGVVRIYNADVRSMVDVGMVAAAVTSPPYNVGLAYDQHHDVMPWDEYQALAKSACELMSLSLIDGGRAWVNVTPVVPSTPIPAGDHSGRGKN